MSDISELEEFKNFIKHLADESGSIIKSYFRKSIVVENKPDESPVTIADKKAEEIMREMIMKEFPEHGILGEEFGDYNPDAEYKWVLDPIDGTKSFVCGTVTFGTLIALVKNGQPILGVINQPILQEYLIGDNQTAELNGVPVKVRECTDLSEAVLLTTDHLNIAKYQNLKNFERLMRKVKLYRNWGDCYGYYLLATGFADIMIDPIMSTWDTMALIPIVRGAGGIITDYQGNDPLKGNSIIAASRGIHSEVIKRLN
ncbi:MAG: histidinol-phosphatase [Bacteroidetes bacterium]|nr:histidinol-phosphatase [Bacteroidota bacterium]MBU2585177.1 histidinol-phosphatase [Bacteroidota bacterium]